MTVAGRVRRTLRGGGASRGRSIFSAYSPVYAAVGVAVAIWFLVLPQALQRFSIRTRALSTRGNRFSGSFDDDADASAGRALALSPAPAKNPYEGAAIVTLAGGDSSARSFVALLQSIRDVGTTLPIVVLLARGGLG